MIFIFSIPNSAPFSALPACFAWLSRE